MRSVLVVPVCRRHLFVFVGGASPAALGAEAVAAAAAAAAAGAVLLSDAAGTIAEDRLSERHADCTFSYASLYFTCRPTHCLCYSCWADVSVSKFAE